jgi:hypothetical protein
MKGAARCPLCSQNAHDEGDGRTPTLVLCSRNARPQKGLIRRPHVDHHGCPPREEQLKPTLGALETAARLSERPFSAQVMILCAILSSLLLGMYWAYSLFFVNHLFQEAYRGMCEQWQQTGILVKERLKVRLKVGASGVILLYTFGYELPISYFVEGGGSV